MGDNMDHDLKQRLVGAVVITALAAIFVPMLFDDPVSDGGKVINELQIPEPPVGRFSETSEKLLKSADQVLALPEPSALQAEQQKHNIQNDTAGLERWFIQVGSFGQRENALLLQKKLRKKGLSTFVDSIEKEKGSTLFRLRVGPELNKERAEAIKAQLAKEHQLPAILVAE